MRIPDDKIEEVRATVELVDVAGEYTRMKRSGSRYKGLCPFHDENTPSFTVDPEKNLYHCFGCKAGGDLFKFVQEVEGMSFIESVRMLAERAGVDLPEGDAPEESDKRAGIHHALRFAANFYFKRLMRSDEGEAALRYLHERGFEDDTIKEFGLGWAPDAWDGLLEAAQEEQIKPETLEEAGLVKARKKSDGYYDRFRGRIMFPILSHMGKVLGFGGRILNADDDAPKYINTPETAVYNKRRVLYGMHQARRAIRDAGKALLVEGYTDVTALHQAGVETAVASSGTALTRQQIELLGRYADRIVLLYDADEAGVRAAMRGIDRILEESLAPYVVALPEGQDPDSFVFERDAEAFREYVEEHRDDFVAFKYAQAGREGQLDTPESKAEAQREVIRSIAQIPDRLTQDTYVERASDVLGVPDIHLHEELQQIAQQERRHERRTQRRRRDEQRADNEPPPDEPSDEEPDEPLPPEKMLHRLMLERGAPLVEFVLGHMALDEFTEGISRRMAQAFVNMYEDDEIDVQRFLSGQLGDDLQRLASEVMMDEHEASAGWNDHDISVPAMNEDPREAAASAMTQLKLRRVNEARRAASEKIYQAERDGGDLRAAQEEKKKLDALRRHIKSREYLEEA
jgi:DNA primase